MWSRFYFVDGMTGNFIGEIVLLFGVLVRDGMLFDCCEDVFNYGCC